MRTSILAATAIIAPVLAGCGTPAYMPHPSPRLQVVSDASGLALARNGRTYPIGMFGSGLEEAVQGNARAEEEVKAYQSRSIAGFVLGILGSASSAGGAGLLVANELNRVPSDNARIAAFSLVIGGLVASIVGGVVSSSAQPHMWNAINMYNDDLPPPYGFGASYGRAPAYAPTPGYAPAYPGGPYAAPQAWPSAAPAPQAPIPVAPSAAVPGAQQAPAVPAPAVPAPAAPAPAAPAPSAPVPSAPPPSPGAPR